MAGGAKTGPHTRLAAYSGKGLRWYSVVALGGISLAFLLVRGSAATVAQDEAFPLEPPDTTSSRGTLFNLIDNVVEANRILNAAARHYEAAPGLFKSDRVRAQEARHGALEAGCRLSRP